MITHEEIAEEMLESITLISTACKGHIQPQLAKDDYDDEGDYLSTVALERWGDRRVPK